MQAYKIIGAHLYDDKVMDDYLKSSLVIKSATIIARKDGIPIYIKRKANKKERSNGFDAFHDGRRS